MRHTRAHASHRGPTFVLSRGLALAVAVASMVAASVVAAPAVGAAPRLQASATSNMDPNGATVQVSGSGYDTNKGIYVALCVIPADPGVAPGPCGGGVAMEGSNGASHWISSNPPSYGVGLAVPYGAGGTFSVSMRVNAQIGPNHNCLIHRCALTTRNDHTRSGDRSQDVLVPVSFRAPAPAPNPGAPAPAPASPAPNPAPAPPDVTPAPNTPAAPGGNGGAAPPRPEAIPGTAADDRSASSSTTTPSTTSTTTTTEPAEVRDATTVRDRERADEDESASASGTLASSDDGDSSGSGAIVGIVLVALLVAGAVGTVVVRRRGAPE